MKLAFVCPSLILLILQEPEMRYIQRTIDTPTETGGGRAI